MLKQLFDLIEKIAIKRRHWTCIPESRIAYFHVDLMTHKGKTVILEDGTQIFKGDPIGELHVNNNNMPEITLKTLKAFSRSIDEELVLLAKALGSETYQPVKAFYGRTMLYPFVAKKGFQVLDIQGRFMRIFLSVWDPLIRKAYAKSEVKSGKGRKSKEIWISRSSLLKKLGDQYE